MTYSKLPKVIQDFGLGFESVNTAQDNEQYIHDTFDVEHWVQFKSKFHQKGGHSVVTIPRVVGAVKTSTFTPITGQTQTWFWFDVLTAGGYVNSAGLVRYAPGFYFIVCAHTDGQVVWCEATPEGGSGDVRFISTRYQVQAGGTPLTSIFVRCLELQSGSFALADYNFSLALFSR